MKSTNIWSTVQAKQALSDDLFEMYCQHRGLSLKEHEYDDLRSLVDEMGKYTKLLEAVEGYFIGYRIKQINAEFDLLRIGEDSIINIELKSQNTEEEMKNQLIRNQYYLAALDKEVLSYTYVSEEEQLYKLDTNENMKEVEISTLITKILEQELINIEDISSLFDPTVYLVSPFNSTEKFLNGSYFLTENQETIKKSIFKKWDEASENFFAIEGAAGTGKTLLTYDIARSLRDKSYKVLIVNVANLNRGHEELRYEHDWNIIAIKEIENYQLNDYDWVIVDEAQRLRVDQVHQIYTTLQEQKAGCIFSFDKIQILSRAEQLADAPNVYLQIASPAHYEMSIKIRTNAEIASFVLGLFNFRHHNKNYTYSSVDIEYMASNKDIKKHLRILEESGWKVINYTPTQHSYSPYHEYQYRHETAHSVIGQEFDNVAVVIDQHFYYDNKGRLDIQNWPGKMIYNPVGMLFQMVTRTRKRIKVIIFNNEVILQRLLRLIG